MAKKKKKLKPVFWITGNYYDCRKMWNKIVGNLDDPNVVSVDCGFNPQDAQPEARVAEAAEIRRLIRMKDIFDSRPRIIRMVGIPPDYSDILDYLKYLRDDNVLVIDSPIGYYKQRTFVSAAASKFYKYIKENGKVFSFESRAKSHKAAVEWVNKLAHDYNREFENDAIELLVATKGFDFDTLYCESLKLFDYTDKKLTTEDVKECSIPVFERAIWEFIEQLNRQRYDSACQYIEEFIADAENLTPSKRRGLMDSSLGAIAQNFEALIHAKDCCKSSLSYQDFWKGLEPLKKRKEKQWIDRYSKGFCFAKIKDGAFQLAYGWPKSKIYGALLILRHLHPKLRYEPENWKCVLSSVAMFVCGKITERQALTLGGFAPDEVDGIVGVD